jgi:hypothetical protein
MAGRTVSRIPAATVAATAAVASAAVSAVTNDPASALERARARLTATETEIAGLWTERDAAVAAYDGADEVLAIDRRIEHANRSAKVYRDRISSLQCAQRDRHRQQREQDKAAAVDVFEARLTDRAAAAARVEKAVAELSRSVAAYQEACRAAFAGWPHGLFPSFKVYEGYSHGFLAEHIASLLGMTRGSPNLRLAELAARLGAISERDIATAASLVAEIKAAPLPDLPDEIEEDAA